MKLFTSLIITVVLAGAIFVAPAAAFTPQDVMIFSDMSTWPSGTFEASGPAVDAGFICPVGTVSDEVTSTAGGQSPVLILFVHKHLVCDDGSGTIEMDLNVQIASSGTTARWFIVAGSGRYQNLSGEGSVYATYTDSGFYDTFSGKLFIQSAVSTPRDVMIFSDMTTWPNGTFEASGPAVDAGFICPAGTVYDEVTSTGGEKSPVLVLFVHKHLVCDDGSGTIEMDLNARIAPNGTTARWLIVAGSGSYENLSGEGSVYATYLDQGFYDTFSGKLDLH